MGTLSKLGKMPVSPPPPDMGDRPMRKASVTSMSAEAPITSVDFLEVVALPLLLSEEWWLDDPPSSNGCSPSSMGS